MVCRLGSYNPRESTTYRTNTCTFMKWSINLMKVKPGQEHCGFPEMQRSSQWLLLKGLETLNIIFYSDDRESFDRFQKLSYSIYICKFYSAVCLPRPLSMLLSYRDRDGIFGISIPKSKSGHKKIMRQYYYYTA